ncbi:MAG: hypothetical protein NT154_00530 [Verrucomicrobia bacterium]|nr:hypothetical protein [Verrucomicrobiota bacterium]
MQLLIILLVTLACFTPLVLVLWRISHRPRRKCPACGHSGLVAGFGRFRCAACGRHFILGYYGGAAKSLLAALLAPLMLAGGLLAVLALIYVLTRDYREFWILGLLATQLLFGAWMAARTKRFPNVDES